MIAEVRVTDLAVHEHLLDPALREVIVQEQIGLRIDAGGIEFEADAVFGIESFGKARIDDGHEILVFQPADRLAAQASPGIARPCHLRSEEHTSELQSLMRISYAVFCLKKKKAHKKITYIKF